MDREIDFHHYTRTEMRAELERIWSRRAWHGLRRVRVIHGCGAVLWRELRRWCDEKGIEWTTEPQNPGVTILHPGRRALPSITLHRPMAPLRQNSAAGSPPLPGSSNSQHPTPSADAPDLMAEEFDRLAREDRRALRRRKHAADD